MICPVRLAVAGVLASVAVPTAAEWSSDPAVNNPAIVAVGADQQVIAVSDGAGGVVVVAKYARFDPVGGGTFYGARAQRLDPAGNPVWAAGGVALAGETLYGPDAIGVPSIAATADGSGGAIVAWRDVRNDAGDIYAQRISGVGTLAWGADGLAVAAAAGQQRRPSVAADGVGGAIFVWQGVHPIFFALPQIYAHRVNADGAIQWTANGLVVALSKEQQFEPKVLSNGNGGTIVAWTELRPTGWHLLVQRLDGAGAPQWAPAGVSLNPSSYEWVSHPALAADGASGAIVAWEDYRNGDDFDVYARRVNDAGVPQWTENGVHVAAAANAVSPVVVADGSGGAIVAWTDARNGASDVFAQRLSAAGAAQWTANGVTVCGAAFDQLSPAAVADGGGGIVLAWHDSRNGEPDVFAQRLSSAGAALWAADGRAVSTAPSLQVDVAVATDGASGGLFAWSDYRHPGTGPDVYAAQVNAAGNLPVALERFTVE